MKCIVTLTDKIQPGSVRVTSLLPDGQVMRFNRNDEDVTWSGDLHPIVARDLRRDGYGVAVKKADEKAACDEFGEERRVANEEHAKRMEALAATKALDMARISKEQKAKELAKARRLVAEADAAVTKDGDA